MNRCNIDRLVYTNGALCSYVNDGTHGLFEYCRSVVAVTFSNTRV